MGNAVGQPVLGTHLAGVAEHGLCAGRTHGGACSILGNADPSMASPQSGGGTVRGPLGGLPRGGGFQWSVLKDE